MIIDGERVKKLVSQAEFKVVICAPFIKLRPFKSILNSVPKSVPVMVVTRWRANEVALGVSDLEILDIINGRKQTELRLLNELHAKLFVADNTCLAGSANVTAAALGWSNNPNLELLLELSCDNPNILALIGRISGADLATQTIRSSIEKEAKSLLKPNLEDQVSLDEDQLQETVSFWLPKCAAPDKLFEVYLHPKTTNVASGTLEDAKSDLLALFPPKKLSKEDFISYISKSLYNLPSFQRVIAKIPSRITDDEGRKLVSEIKGGQPKEEAKKQWEIVRDWIKVFLSKEFEIAPSGFEIRPKSR